MKKLKLFFFISISFIVATAPQPLGRRKSPEQPVWLAALRESIFKTISPSPSLNSHLYKSFLKAPFYGSGSGSSGCSPSRTLLARGEAHYSAAKGHWILCQENCSSCAECLLESGSPSGPSLKWSLRCLLVREPLLRAPRLDLQLTILPQPEGGFHMGSLRSRAHVYVARAPLSAPKRARAARSPIGKVGSRATRSEESRTGPPRRVKKQLGSRREGKDFSAALGSHAAAAANYTTPDGNYSRILGRLSALIDAAQRGGFDSGSSTTRPVLDSNRTNDKFAVDAKPEVNGGTNAGDQCRGCFFDAVGAALLLLLVYD